MTGRLALRLSSPWGISNSCCGCGRKFALSLRWKIRSVSRDQSCLGRYVMLGIVHIVDDDASFRTAIERRLKKAGYEVATYPSAQHLLDRLPNESGPGCLLLDVRIPGLSGPELQSRLGELGSTLPIVFVSGYENIQTTVQTVKAGAEDFLIKPVTSDVLLAAIERAIARHDVSRKLQS